MKNKLMALIGFGGLGALILSAAVSGQVRALEGKIMAQVNGQPVYEWEISLAEDEIGQELAQVTEDQRRAILLRYVIDTRLMALAGEKDELDKGDTFKHRMAYSRSRALRDSYFEKNIRDAITDKQLQAIYQLEIKKIKPVQEVKARHILVKKEEDALDIIERLNRGDDFVTLAKEKSTGPSGRNGGDLGYFPKGRMVKSFEEAAFALKAGGISAPVKSSFGWHIIKVEDKRMTPIPSFDDLKDQIKARLVHKKSLEITTNLRKSAKIEIVDKELAKKVQVAK
jgi:peptidyl-prolyl cis-trans isomerase C